MVKDPEKESFYEHFVGKGEILVYCIFSPFSHHISFSRIWKFIICTPFDLLPANLFILEKSRILLFGTEFERFPYCCPKGGTR